MLPCIFDIRNSKMKYMSIVISGIVFHTDQASYDKLSNYLNNFCQEKIKMKEAELQLSEILLGSLSSGNVPLTINTLERIMPEIQNAVC